MLLLAFDTSSAAVSVALHDGHDVVGEVQQAEAQRHGELLAPSIAEVLRDAGAGVDELTEVAVGVGPGPFTGLRVGLATANALGAALGIPVLGVVSLDALAAEAGNGEVVVVADARRREVYWATYAAGQRVTEPAVSLPGDVVVPSGARVVGAGAQLYPDVLSGGPPYLPSAAWLARVAVAGRTVPVQPLYLRRPDAVAPGARKPALR